jgi:hypothetical protein
MEWHHPHEGVRRKNVPASETRRAVAWVKDEPFGVEFAEINIGRSR